MVSDHSPDYNLQGVALDGRVRGEEADLASSTLLADENSRDIFGMVISYTAKVRKKYSYVGLVKHSLTCINILIQHRSVSEVIF